MKQYSFLIVLSFIFFSCKKESGSSATSVPSVTTKNVGVITSETALSGGTITADGGSPIISRGVCWATSPGPIATTSHTTDGTGVGSFSSNIIYLNANTTYYVRAYATNNLGTGYGNEMSFTTLSPSVYVVGWEYNQNDVCVARLWKDGIPIYISNNTVASDARAVYVSNSDVYIAGTESEWTTQYALHARIWKNGILNTLSNASNSAANSIFVSGSDVYVAGYEGSYAKFWKNNTVGSLTSITNSFAKSIFVSGSDVYVSGSANSQGKVWKNGIETSYGDGINQSAVNSVFVSGTDVYAAGYNYPYAKIWKNNIGNTLATGVPNGYDASSVFVSGTDVYVAGYEGRIAKVWKNGVATNLNDGTNQASATSVFVYNNDVYVAGDEYTTPPITVAKIWKNGVSIPLSDGTKTAVAMAVFVR